MTHENHQEIEMLFEGSPCNNLRVPENKGAIELGCSSPLIPSMKGYLQYVNGYGESLPDYNDPVEGTGTVKDHNQIENDCT